VSAIAIGTWAPRRGGVWAINFDTLIRNEAPREILERVVARLREISGVARKYSGLEQADFNVRPSLSINETLTQPGALETVESALDELMGIASE
jgi:hypothetical protein